MSATRCRVSFTDTEGIEYVANVQADTLYDAVALAVREFADDPLVSQKPSANTPLTVSVMRDPCEHKLKLNQVERWAASASSGPGDKLRKTRIASLLNMPDRRATFP